MAVILHFDRGVIITSSVILTLGILTSNIYLILFGSVIGIATMIEEE